MAAGEGPSLADVIKKAWLEPDYKERLLADPAAALRELGANPPDDVELVVVEARPGRKILVLPRAPDDLQHLTAERLAAFPVLTDTTGPTTFGGMHTCTKQIDLSFLDLPDRVDPVLDPAIDPLFGEPGG
jgi:hypothetical protein